QEFPQAKVARLEDSGLDTQVTLSTSKIISEPSGSHKFETGVLLDADMFLARPEYDATFAAFLYIKKLSHFFSETLYAFTRNRDHYVFATINLPWETFYQKELEFRKELNLPPFGRILKIIMRAANENKLCKGSNDLYNRLKKKELEIYGPFKEEPFKLRGKFRYCLIIKYGKNRHTHALVREEIANTKGLRCHYALIIK
ncbi:MAG: hypothetical protein PHQ96_09650, partial [Candidatus Omnitrophica bacterium]|nr:hypothetical protein [Candidatus Omnitrophota bacterium]